jgi:hypothetical protein
MSVPGILMLDMVAEIGRLKAENERLKSVVAELEKVRDAEIERLLRERDNGRQ